MEDEEMDEDGDAGAVTTTSSLKEMDSSSSSDSEGVANPGKFDNSVVECTDKVVDRSAAVIDDELSKDC